MIAKINEITTEVKKRVKNNFEHYGFQESSSILKFTERVEYPCLKRLGVPPGIKLTANPSPCPTN